MPVRTVCFCKYLTRGSWDPQFFHSYKFIQSLKPKDIKGYAWVPVRGVKRRLTNVNRALAFDWFGQMVADYLSANQMSGPYRFVPIPNHECTVSLGTAPDTIRLAEAIVRQVGGVACVIDCLRWKEDLGSASSGEGPREPEILYPNLVLTQSIESAPHILVDDVLTTGGHVQACETMLAGHGASVQLAACAGRTVHVAEGEPFQLIELDLREYRP